MSFKMLIEFTLAGHMPTGKVSFHV